MSYINLLCNILLSPLSFLLFFLLVTPFSHAVFVPGSGTNVSRLVPWTYLLFCVGLFVFYYLLVELYNIAAPLKISLLQILQPKYYWLSVLCWLVTAFTLSTYIKGMEGNILGFIFFPMILLAALALIAVNISSVIREFDAGGSPIALNTWIAFAIHGCSPLLVLLFFNNSGSSVQQGVLQNLLAIYFFYGFIIAGHWLVFLVAGKSFSLSTFFGAGQSLIYFLPFVGGALIYCYYGFSVSERLAGGVLKNSVYIGFCATVILSVALQFINYLHYLRRAW